MLPRNVRQELFSLAYVRAVAARAGMVSALPDADFGFDLYLRELRPDTSGARDAGPQIDLQLKSTTQADIRESDIAYDLEARAYKLLRNDRVYNPRLLVLLVLPDDESLWLNQSEDRLLLRRCAYWHSLRGAPESAAQRSVRVFIPRANVFTVEALQQLMTDAGRRTGA